MSEASSPAPSQSSSGGRPQRIPTLLLLVMFSIAARYSATGGPAPTQGEMWTAGDSYMEDAKVILDNSYAQSRPATCQALLLLGYREVGIGAMAQAWLYIGMAVRMAQDLGLHKNADKWSNTGKVLFNDAELQERRRIWYGCVIMDKYISAYIGWFFCRPSWCYIFTIFPGRPVAIFENDFDTELPSVTEVCTYSDTLSHHAHRRTRPMSKRDGFPTLHPCLWVTSRRRTSHARRRSQVMSSPASASRPSSVSFLYIPSSLWYSQLRSDHPQHDYASHLLHPATHVPAIGVRSHRAVARQVVHRPPRSSAVRPVVAEVLLAAPAYPYTAHAVLVHCPTFASTIVSDLLLHASHAALIAIQYPPPQPVVWQGVGLSDESVYLLRLT